MESEFIKLFISQGAWAVLFVWLLFDSRKDSKGGKIDGICNNWAFGYYFNFSSG